MGQTLNGAWLAIGVAGAAAAAGALSGASGSRATRGIPEEAWIYTAPDGHRWATDGFAMVRDDAPAALTSTSSKGMMRGDWIAEREDPKYDAAIRSLPDLIEFHQDVARHDMPKSGKAYFNKCYAPILKAAAAVRTTKTDANMMKEHGILLGPLAVFDKHDRLQAIVMPIRVGAERFGVDSTVVDAFGKPHTVRV